MSFPHYENYQDTSIEWLGAVPQHWKVIPLKYIVSIRSGATPSKENKEFWDGDVPWASAKDLKSEFLSETLDHISDLAIELGAAEMVPAGAVLVLVRGMMLARTFPVAITSIPMAINQDLKALTSRGGVNEHYLAWLLRGSAADSLGRVDEAGHGTKALRMEAWTSMPLPLPPLSEQVIIASLLKRETAKIDALVEQQKWLVELLKEKRQAVISHAVTVGIDPTVPMTESGLDWPRLVPAHWKVLPLARVVRQFVDYRGVTPQKLDQGAVPLITAAQIKDGRIDHSLDPVFISEEEYIARMTRGLPEKGDVLLTTEAPLGETAQIEDERVSPGQRIILMKPDLSKITKAYLFAHFRSQFGQKELWIRASGSTASGIRADRIRASSILVPPLEEQHRIVHHIEDEISHLPEIEDAARKQIELLEERRSALISAAVTGKIDVRGLVPAKAEAA
jgi:type I restriction enzyme, S subunit